jgi:hypothetical protein
LDAVSACLRLCVPRVSSAANARLAVWYMHDVNGTTRLVQKGSDHQLVHAMMDTDRNVIQGMAGVIRRAKYIQEAGSVFVQLHPKETVGLSWEGSGE